MLNLPNRRPNPDIKVYSSRVPTPDEMVIVPAALLRTGTAVTERLNNSVDEMWGLSGDIGELMQGVNVNADHLEILTTAKGCDAICTELGEYVTLKPATTEKKLDREADVEGKMMPVYIKSHYAELVIEGVKLEVYGDKQIKVGEWEWGDPIFFTPEYTYVSGGKIPLVPLSLSSELDIGLGWLDRVSLITDAVIQKHHQHT